MGKIRLILICLFIFCITTSFVYAKTGDLWKTTGNVTIRKEPDASSQVVSYLKKDIIVEEIEQSGRWMKIKSSSGIIGWVHMSMFVAVDNQAKVDKNNSVIPVSEKITNSASIGSCAPAVVQSGACPLSPSGVVSSSGKQAEVKNEPKVKNMSETINPQSVQKKVNSLEAQQKSKVFGMSGVGFVPSVSSIKETKNVSQDTNKAQTTKKEITIDQLLKGVEVSTDYENKTFQENVVVEDKQPFGLASNSYIVAPEKMTAVKMSSSDINRIVCSTDIKDVVFSEEKGVQVKISGTNAFVKFVIKRMGEKEIYSKIPVDMYIVCGNKVYNLIGIPERIPSVTVYLEDKESKIKEILEKNNSMPYEKKIVNYVKAFMSGQIPPETTFINKNLSYSLYRDIDITEKGIYVIEGEGIVIRFFYVTGKKSEIEIREKDFLRKEITQNPLAISLDKLKLNLNERAVLLIVERARG